MPRQPRSTAHPPPAGKLKAPVPAPSTVLQPDTVDAYLAACTAEVRPRLQALRDLVRAEVPGGEERISYRMPAVFLLGRVVVYFAAFKHHIGLYPPVADPALCARLARWAGPKGNLQFPHAEPLPMDVIAEVVRAQRNGVMARRQALPIQRVRRDT